MDTSQRMPLPWPPLPGPGQPWALYVDLDGTLVELMPHPDDVVIPPHTLRLLARLQQGLGGALCIVSGRPLAQLRSLFGGDGGPLLVGSHGAETADRPGASSALGLEALRGAIERDLVGASGVWVEAKPTGVAVHFRQCPSVRPFVHARVQHHVAALPGWRVFEGHCVVEVAPIDVDKGRAVMRVSRMGEFRARIPVALGDDATDEDAFAAASSMGGFGIAVGRARATRAQFAVPNVAAVHGWLAAVADRLEAR